MTSGHACNRERGRPANWCDAQGRYSRAFGTVQCLLGPVDLVRFDFTVKVPTEGSDRTSRHRGPPRSCAVVMRRSGRAIPPFIPTASAHGAGRDCHCTSALHATRVRGSAVPRPRPRGTHAPPVRRRPRSARRRAGQPIRRHLPQPRAPAACRSGSPSSCTAPTCAPTRCATPSSWRAPNSRPGPVDRPTGEVLEPELTFVLFERNGWSPPDRDQWATAALADGLALVTPDPMARPRRQGRLAFLHPDTDLDAVRALFPDVGDEGDL